MGAQGSLHKVHPQNQKVFGWFAVERSRSRGSTSLARRCPIKMAPESDFEKGHLKVENCRFLDNENGILTGGHAGSTLEILQ